MTSPAFTPHPWPWAQKAPAYVYRCFDANMKPLYVGMTEQHPYGRLSDHVKTKAATTWFPLVKYLDWAEFPDKETARRNETAEIRLLRPLYNKTHLEHLRPSRRAQNGHNRRKQATPASSRFKGVSWERGPARWRATISPDGKTINLGLFTNETEAARAYDRAALEHFGEFAWLNFPKVVA